MNQKQALSQLEPVFHDKFKELCQAFLWIHEKVLGAANCSVHGLHMGFVIVTTSRIIDVSYWHRPIFGARRRIKYESFSDGTFGWYPSLASPLTSAEIDSIHIDEHYHHELHRLERKQCSVKYEDQEVELIRLDCYRSNSFSYPNNLPFKRLSFEKGVGEEMYELLLKCLRGEASLMGPISTQDDRALTTELQRLSELYRGGLLSDEQFEAAKNKLLEE